MNNFQLVQRHAQSVGMGGLGTVLFTDPTTGAKFTTEMRDQGYTMDEEGNIYWPGGTFMSGPRAYGIERPRTVAAAAVPQTYVLPNGQRAVMTPDQYANYLAAIRINPNTAPPGSLIATGLGTGFSSFAAQFGVSPTTLILLFVAGAFLLFRQPPQRK